MDDEQYLQAVLCAIRHGNIETMSDVCKEKSSKEIRGLASYIILRREDGKSIAKISLTQLAQSQAPTSLETTHDKAIAWAYTMGYDFPTQILDAPKDV